MSPNLANILVVERRKSDRPGLAPLLAADPRLRVVATAHSGPEALAYLQAHHPHAVVMDMDLDGLNGFETARQIMETCPLPVILCGAGRMSADSSGPVLASEAGAVAWLQRPEGLDRVLDRDLIRRMAETTWLMSEIKVVRRWPRRPAGRRGRTGGGGADTAAVSPEMPRVVAIGASTGGPHTLKTILAGLPLNFPVPVLIVQHMSAGFMPGLASWLQQVAGYPVDIASHEEMPLPGRAYLAPDGRHLGLRSDGRVDLNIREPDHGLRPSVSHLFRSVALACGSRAAGVLLTGMGRDGAEELKRLRDLGAVTIVQDEKSSVVHGMPGEALRLGAAIHGLTPASIPPLLVEWAAKKPTCSNAYEHPPPRHAPS